MLLQFSFDDDAVQFFMIYVPVKCPIKPHLLSESLSQSQSLSLNFVNLIFSVFYLSKFMIFLLKIVSNCLVKPGTGLETILKSPKTTQIWRMNPPKLHKYGV